MTAARWSPAELNQQQLVVREIALRAEVNRRQLVASRHAFAEQARSALTSPWVIGGSFVLGFLLLRPAPRQRGAAAAVRLSRGLRRVAASVVWLTHLYRQFRNGMAAGARLTARPGLAANAPVSAAPDEEG
jgi:hypothetical protein